MVVVREQSSTVVQVVPNDAPMLYLPATSSVRGGDGS